MQDKTGIKILLVESSEASTPECRIKLEKLGYHSLTLTSGISELKKYIRKEFPEVIILKFLSEADSIDSMELVGSWAETKAIPIILIFGELTEAERKKAIRQKPHAILIEPVSSRQIDIAIEMVLYQCDETCRRVRHSSDTFNPVSENGDYFFIRGNSCYEKINLDDIAIIEAAASSCKLKTLYKNFVISTNLNNLLDQLEYDKIVRVHRSFAINVKYLKAFDEHSLYIWFSNELKEIPIGNRFKSGLMAKLPKIRTNRL